MLPCKRDASRLPNRAQNPPTTPDSTATAEEIRGRIRRKRKFPFRKSGKIETSGCCTKKRNQSTLADRFRFESVRGNTSAAQTRKAGSGGFGLLGFEDELRKTRLFAAGGIGMPDPVGSGGIQSAADGREKTLGLGDLTVVKGTDQFLDPIPDDRTCGAVAKTDLFVLPHSLDGTFGIRHSISDSVSVGCFFRPNRHRRKIGAELTTFITII